MSAIMTNGGVYHAVRADDGGQGHMTRWIEVMKVSLRTALLGCLLATAALGSTGMTGKPPFVWHAVWLEKPGPDGSGRIIVELSGKYPEDVLGTCRLRLPERVQLLAGDTVKIGYPGLGNGIRWEIRVRCTGSEVRLIEGQMVVEAGDRGRDESEFELRCSSNPGSLGTGHSRAVRLENVRNKQRSRYAGLFMVPVDTTERITLDDLVDRGTRATVLESRAIANRDQLPSVPDTLTCVVFIRPDGSAREVRVLARTAGKRTPELDDLAITEVPRWWRFRPAKVGGKAYSDFVLIRVPLRGQ